MTNDAPILTDRHSMHEGVCTFHDFLTRFRKVLPCRLIMTPWDEVKTVDRQGDRAGEKKPAQALMDEHSFSSLPVVEEGELRGLYLRLEPNGKTEYENTKGDHFFPYDGDVISLLRHMRDAQRFAVLLGDPDNPQGLVTYADFSKRPARVILFAVVAEIEYLLACAIDRVHPDDAWLELVEEKDEHGRNPREELRQRKEDAKHWDTIMPLTTFAEIGHLVGVVERSQEVMRLLGEDDELPRRLQSLPDLRNRVAHVVKPVIAGPKQIKSIANQMDLMFEWIDRWETRLSGDQQEGIGG